jgi:glutamate carboxypeptidase
MRHEVQIAGRLGAQQEAMLALLAEVVNVDRGSYDKAGVDDVGWRSLLPRAQALALAILLLPATAA